MSPTEPAPAAAAIDVDDVTVAYRSGAIALTGVSLRLDRPTICALVGMNGAGKSTLFKTIMGFVEPQRGRVTIGGAPVRVAQKANRVAYVPQAEEVDWTFPVSVEDVVMMGRQGRMGFLRRPSATDRRLVADSLARVGMADFAGRQIGELSGGQRKRVFLARALAQQASILLLDEPFTGVDAASEAAIIAILRALRDDGAIVLVATHDLASVPDFCDTVAMVNRRLVAFGPVETTFTEANLAAAFGGVRLRALPTFGPPAAVVPGATAPAPRLERIG